MFTLEQKVDLILRYIATTDKTQRSKLKKLVVEALNADPANTVVTRDQHAEAIEEMIIDFLKEIGAQQHQAGYNYIICAITLALADRSYLKAITGRLYPAIAERNDTTPSRVERSIRHSVECIFYKGDWGNIAHIFGNSVSLAKGKLPNGEFIAVCESEITRRMKKQGIAL